MLWRQQLLHHTLSSLYLHTHQPTNQPVVRTLGVTSFDHPTTLRIALYINYGTLSKKNNGIIWEFFPNGFFPGMNGGEYK